MANKNKISKKIRKLVHEGYSQKQAVAIAFSMNRKNPIDRMVATSADQNAVHMAQRLLSEGEKPVEVFDVVLSRYPQAKPKLVKEMIMFWVKNGDFVKNPFEDPGIARALAYLLFLRQYPHQSDKVPEKILKVLIEQRLFDKDKSKVTDKAIKMIEEAYKGVKS